MKKFFKPSLWKIILFIIIIIITYSSWLFYTGSFNLTFCPLESPYQQPFSLSETIKLLPNVITGNYDPCSSYTSQSLMTAENIVSYGTIIVFAILSYILACGIVSFSAKNKNKKKK